MDWLVKNAQSRDVERQHLNKILQEIRNTIDLLQSRLSQDSTTEAKIRAVVAQMVSDGTKRGITVTYNATSKAIDFVINPFTIQLIGAVTGTGTVTGLGNVSITTTLSEEIDGVEEAPLDGQYYWRSAGAWLAAPVPLQTIDSFEGSGILALDADYNWYGRAVEGTAGEIEVVDGDGIAGNPTLSLADVLDDGTAVGPVKLYEFDDKGRKTGSQDAELGDISDVDLVTTPPADGDALTYDAVSGTWIPGAGSGGGGIESVVAGVGIEVDDTDPVNPIVGLDAASQASLALADSAVQSIVAGANIVVDDTDPQNPVVSASGGSGGSPSISIQAAETLPARSFVTMTATGAFLADASEPEAGKPAHGFVQTLVSSGAFATVVLSGPLSGFTGLIPGEYYVLSDIALGGILPLSSAPADNGDVFQIVGVAFTTTILNVNIEPAIIRGN